VAARGLDPRRAAALVNGGLELAINVPERQRRSGPREAVRDAMPRLLGALGRLSKAGGSAGWRLSTQVTGPRLKHLDAAQAHVGRCSVVLFGHAALLPATVPCRHRPFKRYSSTPPPPPPRTSLFCCCSGVLRREPDGEALAPVPAPERDRRGQLHHAQVGLPGHRGPAAGRGQQRGARARSPVCGPTFIFICFSQTCRARVPRQAVAFMNARSRAHRECPCDPPPLCFV
jgi:hypothetical protein